MAASRAKDDFLATLSHELRTPLNPVLLLATEAARTFELPPAVREDFQTIAKNVALEARLIDDLLDLTRIVRGKLALEMKPFDVHESLRDALEMSRTEIEQKQISLTLKLDAESRVVQGDDVRLKQVFWNVIKNAAKFTPEGGSITIESRIIPEGDILAVTVTDTGIGMLPEELARIFEAFSQGDHALQGPHRFGGMGLGLAISRMMMEMHSGSIAATSGGRNQGTTLLIKLPLLRNGVPLRDSTSAPSANGIMADAPHSRLAGRPCRILLVEDHKPTSRALVQLLTRRNYQVAAADCVAEARAAVRRQKFDLLISDIGLPDGNGYELMTELRSEYGLPGIALTGYGMEEDVNRSQAVGFVAHLTKPVSVQALEGALAAASNFIAKADEVKA
jgi:CheY-like chemotaxis protein